MTEFHAVIGAGFGDEGKGLMTDYLAQGFGGKALVIRYNGGCQAGHTVQEGLKRTVFHHIGSGTIAGANTHLARRFISNPIMFATEYDSLVESGYNPRVSADSRSPLTTPYDMMINQMIELARGGSRHGSCGLGIGETMVRCMSGSKYSTTIDDIKDEKLLREKLKLISEEYVPERLSRLKIGVTRGYDEYLSNPDIIEAYISKCKFFALKVFTVDDTVAITTAVKQGDSIIFEGAQGLLLDEDHDFFPHVTYSKTGMENIIEILNDYGFTDVLNVHYMIRAYMTRHGAGPFPTENGGIAYEDPTNVPNMWQKSLRFGHLDLPLIKRAIDKDLHIPFVKTGKERKFIVGCTMTVTCMDQVGEFVEITADKHGPKMVNKRDLPHAIKMGLGIRVGHLSFGPTAAWVTEFNGVFRESQMNIEPWTFK